MSGGQDITQELSLSEVVSKTFDLYQRDFAKYLILFVVVEAIIGVVTSLVRSAITLPTLAANATPQQALNVLPGLVGAVISLVAVVGLVSLVFIPLAVGGAVKLASGRIRNEPTDLAGSVRFALSKLVWIWAAGIIVGIIVALGFIALIVPGIILAIMFSLVLPVIMIESPGVLESMGRSRRLVSDRWLKTFALFIVFGVITAIASLVVSLISAPFGIASSVVSGVLSALYLPLLPIVLTVYYYSNVARISPLQMGQAFAAATPMAQAGMKYCPNCGTTLLSTSTFCTKCGAKQPA